MESTIDLVDPCNIRLHYCQWCAELMNMYLAYIDEVNAGEFASLKPSLELF